MTLESHHLAWGKVGNEQDIFSDEILGIPILGNTAQDGAILACAIVDGKLEEFLGFLHFLASLDVTHSDVELLECLKVDSVLDGGSLVGSCLVGFLGGFEFVELLLYRFVLNLLKQEFRLCQLMTRFEQFGASQLIPVEFLQVDELAQLGTAERQERFEGNGKISNELSVFISM